MIATLTGVLQSLDSDHIILDVNGVGYEVFMPKTLLAQVGKIGDTVNLQIYTHMSEAQIYLYGFLHAHEKMLFKKLISVSGIGPKLASTMVSSVPFSELIEAILMEDLGVLKGISGVGAKTAQRVVMELKDKFKDMPTQFAINRVSTNPDSQLDFDVTQALMTLGYSENQAKKALNNVAKKPDDTVQTLIKKSLGNLNS